MMQTTIERLADDQLRLDVEVPVDVLQDALEHTLEELGRDMRVPGFRPGKVPKQAVLARIGRDAAVAEAVSHHIEHWYIAAVTASGIRPVAAPDFDLSEPPSADKPFRFSATVNVVTKPTLPEIATLKVDRPKLPDLTPLVDQVLEGTLRGKADLVPTGANATMGDEVVVDFACTIDGEGVRGASATGYQARLGDGRLLEELEKAILGHQAGAELTIPVNFPSDHPMETLAGKDASFTLTLRDVLTEKIPKLTDEVARAVSEFDSARELRTSVEDAVRTRLTTEIDGIFRGHAVNTLAEAATMDVPPTLLQAKQNELFAGLKQRLGSMGMSLEAWLDRSGQSQEEMIGELEKEAGLEVRRELALLALAEDASIVVTQDDLRAEVADHAAHTGDDADEIMHSLVHSGRGDMLRGELLIQRTIDHLVAHVTAVEVDPPTMKSEPESEPTPDAETES